MPPINLLSRYQLSVGTDSLLSGRRLFPWFALGDPFGLPSGVAPLPGPAFRALLDTGFDGGLLLTSEWLARALGGPPRGQPGQERTFERAQGKLRVRQYALDLWGYELDRGPFDTADALPEAPRFLARDFVVWVSFPANPEDQVPKHPPLLGMAGLRRLEAVLSFDYRTGVCDLFAEGQAPPAVTSGPWTTLGPGRSART